MLAKKAIYYLMAAGPFLLLGLLAINSRTNTNHWQFVEYGPEVSSRILAYAGPVSKVRSLVTTRKTGSPQEVRAALQVWLDAGRRGELEDIPTVTTIEDGLTPIYEQLIWGKKTLEDVTLRQANALISRGEYDAAAIYLVDIVELANIGKYSDFGSVSEGSSTQAEALETLAAIADQLEAERREALAERLVAVTSTPDRSLLHVVNRFAAAYLEDQQRMGKTATLLEVARDKRKYASNDDVLTSRIAEWQRISTSDRSLISSYGRSRIALIQEQRYSKALSTTFGVLVGS